MASRRDTILQELVAQMQAATTGWTVKQREPGAQEYAAGQEKLAVILDTGETVVTNNNLAFVKDLDVIVFVVLNLGDADATLDGGNPERYLHRAVAELEAAIWAQPPPYTVAEILEHRGWENITPEAEEQQLRAEISIGARYMHNIDDPATYDPVQKV